MRRQFLVLAAVSLALTLGVTSTDGAAAARIKRATYEMSVTPAKGPVGTVVDVGSVTPCPTGTDRAIVAFGERNGEADLLSWTMATNGGHWELAFQVPDVAAGDYTVMADCRDSSGAVKAQYQQERFRVTTVRATVR